LQLRIPQSQRGRILSILLLGCLTLLPGTWIMPLVDRDEPRFAEASREMMERENWVVPYFNDVYRFDKPPLIYWMQIGSYRLFGTNDFSARLPSILCTLLTGLLIYGFAGRLRKFHEPEGRWQFAWMAAVIYLTALQTMIHGRAAVADAAMILCTTAALWCGWEAASKLGVPRKWSPVNDPWWWGFVLALALGFLAKGPVAWLPIIPYGVLVWQQGGWRGVRHAGILASLVLATALVGIWGLPALALTDGAFFEVGIGKHVVQRSISVMEGHGASNFLLYLLTLPFYLPIVFIFFLPWSIWLPRLWRDRASRNWMGYLWWWVIVVFVVFSLVKTKLPHYILPAYPALALLLARYFNRGSITETARRGVWKATAAAVIFSLAVGFVAAPIVDRLFLSKRIGREVGPRIADSISFGVTSYAEPSLVWYLRQHTNGWLEILTPDYLERGGVAIIPEEEIPLRFPDGIGDAEVVRISGINPAKGRWMTLVAIIPEKAAAQ